MSSFFTLPKKRKRPEESASRPPSSSSSQKPHLKRTSHHSSGAATAKAKPARKNRDDESISGSDASDSGNILPDEATPESEDEHRDETAEQKRIRLAEAYLRSKDAGDVIEDGFDAADIDREILEERAAESEQKQENKYQVVPRRAVAKLLDYDRTETTFFTSDTQSVTAVAVFWPFIYTASKDIAVAKYRLPPCPFANPAPRRRKPRQLVLVRGSRHSAKDRSYIGHTAAILCAAVSPDGETLATGAEDKKIVLWATSTLTPYRIFSHHRAAVLSLSFRPQSTQLFSAAADRTVKVWIVSPDVTGYVETLFGHADSIPGIAALPGDREMCVSVGGRDRTARAWKVVEEEQLVFRGAIGKEFRDGSLDVLTAYDGSTFITGGDGGGVSLFNLAKKKPLATLTAVHGLDEETRLTSALVSDEGVIEDSGLALRPRWITALSSLENTDLLFSGSWDGRIQVLSVEEGEKGRKVLDIVTQLGAPNKPVSLKLAEAEKAKVSLRGVINDITVTEYPVDDDDAGSSDSVSEEELPSRAGGVLIAASVGKSPRLGRWIDLSLHAQKSVSAGGRNGAYIIWVPYKDGVDADANADVDIDMFTA